MSQQRRVLNLLSILIITLAASASWAAPLNVVRENKNNVQERQGIDQPLTPGTGIIRNNPQSTPIVEATPLTETTNTAPRVLLGTPADVGIAAHGRTIVANVYAIDQPIVYNRFGAFSGNSVIFALARDTRVMGGGVATPGNVRLKSDKRPRPLVLRANEGDVLEIHLTNYLDPLAPGTRTLGLQVNGLEAMGDHPEDGGSNVGLNTASALSAGETRVLRFFCPAAGTYFMYGAGGTAGGEEGSVSRGLFGAVNVEPVGSTWFRSQVTNDQMQMATYGQNPDGTPLIDYNAVDVNGDPILNMLNSNNELIHGDLTAIIANPQEDCADAPPSGTCGQSYREFTIIFHDEIGIQQAFPQLEQKLFHGVRDAFAINYGTGGLGAPVIANRMQIGPAAGAGEARFEEFFLESWANGDPAMVVQRDPITGVATKSLYKDDPSNVYHSYMGDPVRFRNLHAGPSETHVFHLHAHQWLFSPKDDKSVYLDSQTISPGSAFTYQIQYGGSGNRNFTPGDSIFHCHLYPHFAQGMWSLWRSHDTFEDGSTSRNLPDGEITQGTPNPAIVPIPRLAMAPKPTADFKGYPFYIAGIPGRRTPQPPLDAQHDGGLQRHVIKSSEYVEGPAAIDASYLEDPVAGRLAAGNASNPNLLGFAKKLTKAEIKILPKDGTPAEKIAMSFHDGSYRSDAVPTSSAYGWPAMGYPAFDSSGEPGFFKVNGRSAQPGAPFADPCPSIFIDGNGIARDVPNRTYRVAYIQFDMIVNQLGWHDRQARIAVLEQDVAPTLDGTRSPEPLFFRANSGDCIIYHATNLMPANLNLDDFQIFTPTDIIGQHIHLVKFDVTSSDGSANGWNYEDGTFSPDEVRERIEANNHWQLENGGSQILEAEPHPMFGAGPNGSYLGAQTTTQRWWADPLVDTSGADRTIRTVFTHDHFGPSSHQQHGLYAGLVVEPTDSVWLTKNGNSVMGSRPDGGPTSFAARILTGENHEDSYREYMLEFADLVPLYDANNLPIGSPGTEAISTSGGSKVINYRTAPMGKRLTGLFSSPGGDPAYAFSSMEHGDPDTFVFDTYPGDNMQIRWLQGSQGEQHTITLSGHRWLSEPGSPNSGYVSNNPIGISEHFEWDFTATDGFRPRFNVNGSADFLIESTIGPDHNEGIWGLMRAHSTLQSNLPLLPNNSSPELRPIHPLAGSTFPTGVGFPSTVRRFTIEAWLARDLIGPQGIIYNAGEGFHDPDGLVFIHASERADIISGAIELEPLVVRVNAGDGIELTLINNLPLIVAHSNIMSARVGLQPQLIAYDAVSSEGSRIGFNDDTTIGPGEQRTYVWYAGEVAADGAQAKWTPREYGVTVLRPIGDFIHHAQHGGGGVLIVEPQGSQHVALDTMAPILGGYEADILDAQGKFLFREFVLQLQDGLIMRDSGERLIEGITGDHAMFAINNKTEPIWSRLGINWNHPFGMADLLGQRDQSNAMSSSGPGGEPETPICEVEAGMETRLRVANVGAGFAGEPHRSFSVTGHVYQRQPWTNSSSEIGDNPKSDYQATINGLGTMAVQNLVFVAGGTHGVQGDYALRTQDTDGFTDGQWCLLRVTPPQPRIISFESNIDRVQTGQSAMLQWNITGVTHVSIDHGVGANLPSSGSIIVSPTVPTTYTVTAAGKTAQVSINVTRRGIDRRNRGGLTSPSSSSGR